MLSCSLEYESKWWVPVPASFPSTEDESLEAWARRLALQLQASPPWDQQPLRDQLPEILMQQYNALNPDRTAALLYCPYGLPAVGYVEVVLVARPDSPDFSIEQIVSGLESDIAFEPRSVKTRHLGTGFGFTRIVGGHSTDDSAVKSGFAEMSYVFEPEEAVVIVTARSAEAEAIGMMSPELWAVVESITIP